MNDNSPTYRDMERANRAHTAACNAFVAARDSDWTPCKASRIAAARAECNRLNRAQNAIWLAIHAPHLAREA